MNPRLAPIFEALGESLASLPDVFSTPQWGGRAYKLPGPGGNRKKPKLLAFVTPAEDEAEQGRPALSVSFKLPGDRAEAVTERYAWIARHPRGSLGNHGWVAARVTAKRQVATLKSLLKECREQFPLSDPPEVEVDTEAPRSRSTSTSAEARRIERVMREAAAEGWRPGGDDGFDEGT